MGASVWREAVGLLLVVLGVLALATVSVALAFNGVWFWFLLHTGGVLGVVGGVLLGRYDPVSAEVRRIARAKERERAELHRVDPDAVIRER